MADSSETTPYLAELTWQALGDTKINRGLDSNGNYLTWASKTLMREVIVKDSFFIGDTMSYRGKDWEIGLNDKIKYKESLSRTVKYERRIEESIPFNDNEIKHIEMNMDENVIIRDFKQSNSNAIISNFFIGDPDCANSLTPIGYTPWKQFQPGEYTYSKAIFKIKTIPMSKMAEGALHEHILYIDALRISDKGYNIYIPKGGITVYFNRTFVSVPDIFITSISIGAESGGDLKYSITNKTKTSFYIELTTLSGDTADAGMITWEAEGI